MNKNIRQIIKTTLLMALLLCINQLYEIPIEQSIILTLLISTCSLSIDHYMPAYHIDKDNSH